MTLLLAFIGLSLAVMWLTMGLNLLAFPRLRARRGPAARPKATPLVSVLVPARNEAGVIARTVDMLLRQQYARFEVLVLDDQSEDGTGQAAAGAAGNDGRFRLIPGQPLPPGWLGKNWACHQLAAEARGDVLVFTDADVQWQPEALTAVVAQLETGGGAPAWRYGGGADMLTVWPTQITRSWTERLVVPAMALAILAYLPVIAVHFTGWPAFAAANGQCLAIRRRAYRSIGGHEAVRQRIVEDVALARAAKAAGQRLRMADGNRLISCRMYDGWSQVRDGFAKNILAGHGNRVWLLLASTLFHWVVFVLPWFLALTGDGRAVLLLLASVFLRMAAALFTHQRPQDGLAMPLTVMLLTLVAARAVRWRWQGGPRWKGRAAVAADPP